MVGEVRSEKNKRVRKRWRGDGRWSGDGGGQRTPVHGLLTGSTSSNVYLTPKKHTSFSEPWLVMVLSPHKTTMSTALLSSARRAMTPRVTNSLRSMSTKTRADLLAGTG